MYDTQWNDKEDCYNKNSRGDLILPKRHLELQIKTLFQNAPRDPSVKEALQVKRRRQTEEAIEIEEG
jgi:hypothetical protein